MWTIAQQSIYKSHKASIFSRSFCIIGLCYLSVILIPILILVTIGYSWTQSTKTLIKPSLQYQNYQLSCLLNNSTLIYDSSFSEETSNVKSISTISVSSNLDVLDISINVYTANILSCSFQLYFLSKIQDFNSLIIIPLSVCATNSQFVNKITMKGTANFDISKPLSQNSQEFNSINYYTYGQSFSMVDNFKRAAQSNTSISLTNDYVETIYSPSTTSLSINARYQLQQKIYLTSTSLLQNLRQFIPYFIYLLVLLLWLVVLPVTRWMLSMKIYTTKIIQDKLKYQ